MKPQQILPPTELLAAILLVLCGTMVVGCKSTGIDAQVERGAHPDADLSATDQQVRLRIRALIEPMSAAIVESADHIRAGTADPAIQREALVWKIEAVPALREALFRPNPFVAISDAWVLLFQMTDYFQSGPGGEALGEAAPIAASTCQALEKELQTVAASLTYSGNVDDVREFTRELAARYPIRTTIAGRESTLSRVTERELVENFTTQEVVGHMVVTLDDLSRRMGVYSAQLFEQARWQAELFALDMAGDYNLEKAMPLAEETVRATTNALESLNRLMPRIEAALTTATEAPELVTQERTAAIDAARQEISRTIEFVHQERIEALEFISREREATVKALNESIDAEREAVLKETEQVVLRVVDHTIDRMVRLVAIGGGIVIVVAILILLVWRRKTAPGR